MMTSRQKIEYFDGLMNATTIEMRGVFDSHNEYSDEDREKALGEFIVAIRKDLADRKSLRKTELKPEDFKLLRAT